MCVCGVCVCGVCVVPLVVGSLIADVILLPSLSERYLWLGSFLAHVCISVHAYRSGIVRLNSHPEIFYIML